MIYKHWLLVIVLHTLLVGYNASNALAQRYKEALFHDIQLDSMTYAVHDKQELKLDFMYAKDDSSNHSKPLLIFMHGGGFQEGARNKEDITNYCKEWAKRGYLVASISYRLTLKGKSFHCDLAKEAKINTFKEAVYDLHRATAFLLTLRESYRIDTNRIILSGNSAGAEAVLQGVYYKNEDLKAIVLPLNFKYAAVVSHAGAITDTTLITKESAIPAALMHGTCDQLVPYASNYHHFCPENTPGTLLLHGSLSISKRMNNINASYYLATICGKDHHVNKTSMVDQLNDVIAFIYETVILNKHTQRVYLDKSKNTDCRYGNFDFCK